MRAIMSFFIVLFSFAFRVVQEKGKGYPEEL